MAYPWARSARATPDWLPCPPPEAIRRGGASAVALPLSLATLPPLHQSFVIQVHEGAGRAWLPTHRSSGRPPPRHRAGAPSAMRRFNPTTSATPALRMLGSALICNDSVFSPEPCAIAVWLGHGLNTILGPHVRSNAGSPTSVGRPAKYKTLLPLVGAGNTWGVVTSVPACSTVPATGG